MTAEAKEWIESLIKDSRQVFYEIESGPEGLKVVLDGQRITDEEYEKAMHFCKNGSPTIVVETRVEDTPSSWSYFN